MEPIGHGIAMEIRKEAAAWLVEMDDEPERWNRKRFLAWLKSSPRHIEEFLYLTAIWRSFDDGVDCARDIDVWRQLKEPESVVRWLETAPSTPPAHHSGVAKRLHWAAGLAAVALVFVSAAWLWALQAPNDTEILATAIGEQRALKLPDRSVVHLNTNSRVEIRFSDTARAVHLLQGEALFSVEHDANRPFQVHAGGMMVQAIGTQFNVRRRVSDTVVSVIEGRVALLTDDPAPDSSAGNAQDRASAPDAAMESPPALTAGHRSETGMVRLAALSVLAAGEQARVHADGAIEQQLIEDVKTATAWRERRLVFSDTPLAEVTTEVARYNVVPELRIEGEALGARRLTGVFAADDLESLIQFLEQDAALTVTRNGDTVVIRAAE